MTPEVTDTFPKWWTADLVRLSDPSVSSTTHLLASLGYTPSSSTHRDFWRLVGAIKAEPVDALVVDDAHRLAGHTLETLRWLRERSGVGLVLVGPPRLQAHVVDRCVELSTHVEREHVMGGVRPHEAFAMFFVRAGRKNGQKKWRQVAASRALASASDGNFRRLLVLLREARTIARTEHRALSPSIVMRAAAG